MNEKIRIITDSCSSLSKEELEKRGFAFVETSYMLDDENCSAFENEQESLSEFYARLDKVKSCSTGCVNQNAFEECFEKIAAAGDIGIYTGLSGSLSSTYNNAVNAANVINEKYGKTVIKTVDSKTGSIGIQILLDEAEEMIAAGKTLDEIESALNESASNLVSTFICRDLTFLHKCGRINALEWGLGKLLKIVPLVQVEKGSGKLKISDKCLGQKLAYKTLKNKTVNLITSRPAKRFYIASCALDEDVKLIKDHIVQNTHIKEEDIKVCNIDKTMSCCCGPKTIAVFVL